MPGDSRRLVPPSCFPRGVSRFRRTVLLAAVVFCCGVGTAGAGPGYWRITGHVLGPASAMDQALAETYTGKRVFLDDATIQFDSRTCPIAPRLVEHDAATFFDAAFRVPPRVVGHEGDKVFVIETGCDIPGLSSLLLLDDGRMCFYLNGVFFFLSEELE